MEPVGRAAEERGELGGVGTPRRARTRGERAASRRAATTAATNASATAAPVREAPAVPRCEHGRRMARAAHRAFTGRGRPAGPSGPRHAEARLAGRPAETPLAGAGRPTPARPRAAGVATKIDEYVPETMPMSSARTKSRIDGAAEQEQRHQRQDDGEAGVDRAAERLQDRVVDDRGERLAGVAGLVLADPVEDDDRVVDGEADDGQHRGHEQGVDLDPEERPEDRERRRRRR